MKAGSRVRTCLLTGHFGDALQTGDGQGHDDAQAGADHQQAVADEQAGHRQPLVPCADRRRVWSLKWPHWARRPASRLQIRQTWPQRAPATSEPSGGQSCWSATRVLHPHEPDDMVGGATGLPRAGPSEVD